MRQSHPLLEEIDAPALAAAMAGGDPPLLVDVRTDSERALAVIEPSLHIGLDRFVERAEAEIPTDRDVVVDVISGTSAGGTWCVTSITRTSGAIRAITPWQAATKPSKVP